MRAGQQSEMHIAHHSEEQTPVPPGLWPCPTCFLHLTGTDGSWPGVGGERVCTGGSPRGQLTASQERWTAEGGQEGVLGGIASSESQARPFAGTECAAPGLRETPLGPLTGGVTEPRRGSRVLGVHSQTVHPEGVLGGRVGQDHVRVIEHVQSIQGQGVNLEFIQRELAVSVEVDITNPNQRAGQFFREAGRGLSCH